MVEVTLQDVLAVAWLRPCRNDAVMRSSESCTMRDGRRERMRRRLVGIVRGARS